jgi:hypothetical protein
MRFDAIIPVRNEFGMSNVHMWVDPHMTTKAALVSDTLYAALRETKIGSFQDSPHFAEV